MREEFLPENIHPWDVNITPGIVVALGVLCVGLIVIRIGQLFSGVVQSWLFSSLFLFVCLFTFCELVLTLYLHQSVVNTC